MEKIEIGRFTAESFKGEKHEFIVTDEPAIHYGSIIEKPISRLIIKPKFELYLKDKSGRYCLPSKNPEDYIVTYNIEPELFKFLKKNHLIMYSTDMAYLYGFNEDMAYDKMFQTRAFKHVHDRSKILTKQKAGQYN